MIRPFSVLVLDEPTIGLDTASIETLRDFLLKSMSTKRAVLLMTHDELFARSVSTRMLRIVEGRVWEEDKPAPTPRRRNASARKTDGDALDD